jgi:hypothetical protein
VTNEVGIARRLAAHLQDPYRQLPAAALAHKMAPPVSSLALTLVWKIAAAWVALSLVVAVVFGVMAARLQDWRRRERRSGRRDRRIGLPDTRAEPVERRRGPSDRRASQRRGRPSMA